MYLSSQGYNASAADSTAPAPLVTGSWTLPHDSRVKPPWLESCRLTYRLLDTRTPHQGLWIPYVIHRVTPPGQESLHISHSCTTPAAGLGPPPPRLWIPGPHSGLYTSDTSGNSCHKSQNNKHIHNSLHNEARDESHYQTTCNKILSTKEKLTFKTQLHQENLNNSSKGFY